jgi:hypothetical protein
MHRSVLTCSLVLLAAFAPSLPDAQRAADSMKLVIGSGPHAGTYDLPAANITCMRIESAKQFSAVYKDPTATAANAVSVVGINVDRPGGTGPKSGEINITFGDPENKGPFTFDVNVPDKGKHHFSLSTSGKAVTVTFDGQTRDGVKLHVQAHCDDPMVL